MLPVSEISRRLSSKALAVCQMLIPAGREAGMGRDYVVGGVDNTEGKSLVVHLTGDNAGHWRDWATDDRGDLVDLWAIRRGLQQAEAVQQVKSYLGINDGYKPVEKRRYATPPIKDTPPPSPEGIAYKWLTAVRHLKPEILSLYRISVDPEKRAIIFPCYSPSGNLINRSYRAAPEKKVWQDEGCAPSLFGWHALPQESYRKREVLISEGQIDSATWAQWGIPALSIPNGSGQTWIEYEWDNLAVFDTIYISFDMDGSGKANAEKSIARLGKHRCRIISMPYKDANAALQAGVQASEARKWVEEAAYPEVGGLVVSTELEEAVAKDCEPKQKAFTIPFFDKKWPYEGLYFRDGEVTAWTGAYGNGKSTFLNFLTIWLLNSGIPVFIASMEAMPKTTLRRLITAHYVAQKCYFTGSGFRNDAGADITMREAVANWMSYYGPNLTLSDKMGYIEPEALLEQMMMAFRRYGARHFFIDSLMRIEGLEEDYPAQGRFINRLQAFAKDTGSHVHLVCHPKKLERGGKPTGMDIKGASLLPNNADSILVVVRNYEKMEIAKERDLTEDEKSQMHDTEIIVDKQRDNGWLGSFCFKFDPRDYTFSPCQRYVKPKPDKKTFYKQ